MSVGVGIGGEMASGKTAAADHLIEEHGFTRLGFATPLYELGAIHSDLFAYRGSEVHDWTERHLSPLGYSDIQRARFIDATLSVMNRVAAQEGKNRTLLQLLGTEVGRQLDPELWIKLFKLNVERLGPEARIVNDNLRFMNEFEALQDMGFTTIYLRTSKTVRAERYEAEYGVQLNAVQLAHASEAELPGLVSRFDYVYDNDRRLEDLHAFLDRLIASRTPSREGQVA